LSLATGVGCTGLTPSAGAGDLDCAGRDLVDHPVVLGLVGREPAVAVGVALDLLDVCPVCWAISSAIFFLV
jgi:hypothetical protein